jgi:NitT/TauT family transport system permease protein
MRVRFIQSAIVLALLAIWELASLSGIVRPTVLPPPHQAMEAVWTSLRDGTLLPNAAVTLARVGQAFALAFGAGVTIGVILWRLPRTVTRSIEPLLASLYAVPWIAFYPALLVVFGLGDAPVILVAAILSTVPISLNSFIGLSGLKPSWIAVARVYRATLPQRVFRVLVPGAAPHIISGLKLGFIYAYLGVIGTEYLRSTEGLGYLVNTSYYFFHTTQMYGYVGTVVTFAIVITLSFTMLERRIGGRFR